MTIRSSRPADRSEIADLVYASINTWYRLHGMPQIFHGGPAVTDVFYDTYEELDPGCCAVAEHPQTGRLMGSCYFHPRTHHVALGIMNVHPNYFGMGVGSALLRYITDFTDRNGYRSLRLTQSALNLDSFSLYNRAGFVPRHAYQDMMIAVPASGFDREVPGMDRVREATLADVAAMAALEMEIAGVSREQDYRFAITNRQGFWHVSVYEGAGGTMDGFLMSCGHAAMNMVGPGVMRSDEQAAPLIARELDQHRGRSPVVLIPVDRPALVRRMYGWGARNVELHFCQVRGEFPGYRGVNMPMFLMETA